MRKETCLAIVEEAKKNPTPTASIEVGEPWICETSPSWSQSKIDGPRKIKVLAKCNAALRGLIESYFYEKQYQKIVDLWDDVAVLLNAKSICIAPHVFTGIQKAFMVVKMESAHGALEIDYDWFDRFEKMTAVVRKYYMDRLMTHEASSVLRESVDALNTLREIRSMDDSQKSLIAELLLKEIPLVLAIVNVHDGCRYGLLLSMMNKCCAAQKLKQVPRALEESARVGLCNTYYGYESYSQLWCCVLSDLYGAIACGTRAVPSLLYFPEKMTVVMNVLHDEGADVREILSFHKSEYELFLIDEIVKFRAYLRVCGGTIRIKN